MKPVARFQNIMQNTNNDSPLVMPLLSGFSAVFSGVSLNRYFQDGRQMAECQIQCWEHFRYDAVHSVIDPVLEVESLGCRVIIPENGYPYVSRRIHDDPGALSNMLDFNPQETSRTSEVLKSIRIMRDWLGTSALIAGHVTGPVTMVSQLLGVPEYIFCARSDRKYLLALLRIASQTCIRWGFELVNAGAHFIIVHDKLSPLAILPEQFITNFSMLHYRNITRQLKKAGNNAIGLLIKDCPLDLLPLFITPDLDFIGSSSLNADTQESLNLHNTCILETIDTEDFVQYNSNDLFFKTTELLETYTQSSRGYVLSSSGEVPLEASPDAIEAVIYAARNQKQMCIAA